MVPGDMYGFPRYILPAPWRSPRRQTVVARISIYSSRRLVYSLIASVLVSLGRNGAARDARARGGAVGTLTPPRTAHS